MRKGLGWVCFGEVIIIIIEKLMALFQQRPEIDPGELAAIEEQAKQTRREEGAYKSEDVK